MICRRSLLGVLLTGAWILTAVMPLHAAAARQLTVGVIKGGWPPFSLVTNGRLNGLSAAILAQALQVSPTTLTVREFADQTSLLQAACRGELDVVPDLARTPDRDTCLVFSDPYYEGEAVAAAREDRPDLLRNRPDVTATYAVETGFLMAERLRERYPQAKILYVRDTKQALEAVAGGRADLYIGLRPALEYVIRESAIRGLVLFDAHAEPEGALRFAFPRGREALRDEVETGLRRIPEAEREKTLVRWIAAGVTAPVSAERFLLTESERAFLAGLPALKVSLVQWRPYSYVDQAGQQVGILPDYLAYLSRQLGVRFALQQLEPPSASGRALDAGLTDIGVFAVPDDREVRPRGATRPLEAYPVIVVGRSADVTVSNISQLADRRVAVVERANNLELLHRDVPSATPVVAPTIEDCLRLIREGKADAFVGNLAAVDYLLQRDYAGELKVLGPAGYVQSIGFQVRSGLEPLLPILDRALAAMPEAQRLAIRNRYLTTSYRFGPSWGEIARRSVPFALLGGGMLLVLGFAYLRLRREVRLRHQSEQRLQGQLDFQRTLIDAVPIPITVKDRDGRYLAVNAAYESRSGMTRQQMVGHLPTELNVLGSRAAEALEGASRQALETGHAQQFSIDYVDAEGNQRHLLCWAQPIEEAAAASAAVISAAVDVTEIRHAEEKARAAEAMLVEVTRQLPATVFQLRERAGRFSYEWASGNAQQLFGRAPETLIGQTDPLLTIVDPENRKELLLAAEQAKTTSQPLNQDVQFLVGGETRWIRMHAVPRADADGSTLWSGYYADLTEDHARAEALALARDAAEAALRAKESFLAMMSHEIRTPMTGILGLIELLQGTSLKLEQQRMVELARESGHALGQILDDILDYAKIEAGRVAITLTPLDLRELFDGVLGALLPKAFKKGLQLRQVVEVDVPAVVNADGIRLRQILFNLLGNAIKFTERGSVVLRASVEPRQSGPVMLVLAVEDTGIGIHADDLGRLFAPFVQSERSTTRRFGGTGLGLTIARKLAALMEGELTLSSEEGVGTTALLYVPCDVVTQQYAMTALKDRPLMVHVDEPIKREALIAYGLAAGMRCVDPNAPLSVDGIAIVDQPARAAKWRYVLTLSGDLLPMGFREDAEGIWLANNPLRWTAFLAALQAVLQGAPPAAVTSNEVRPASPMHLPRGVSVLVVEDHLINQEVIQQQLRELGYRAAACSNGKEALAALGQENFDLVLTDCHMPVMDGFDLTRAIRNSDDAKVSAMPVVGLTATVAREEHLLCTIVGMDAFLIKPATMAALGEAIEACLQGRPQVASRAPSEGAGEVANVQGALDVDSGFAPEHIQLDALHRLLNGMLCEPTARDRVRQALQADRAALLSLLESPSGQALAEWCHHAGGGLSGLDQPYLRELVHRFDGLAYVGSPTAVLAMGQSLVSMYDYLLDVLKDDASV